MVYVRAREGGINSVLKEITMNESMIQCFCVLQNSGQANAQASYAHGEDITSVDPSVGLFRGRNQLPNNPHKHHIQNDGCNSYIYYFNIIISWQSHI